MQPAIPTYRDIINRARDLEDRCWRSANKLTDTPVSLKTLSIGAVTILSLFLPLPIFIRPVLLMTGGAGAYINRSYELFLRDQFIQTAQEVHTIRKDTERSEILRSHEISEVIWGRESLCYDRQLRGIERRIEEYSFISLRPS